MNMLLAIYFNDHLAGATAATELARRAARSNRRSSYAPFLESLATQIAEDRRSLLEIMGALEIRTDRAKVAAGYAAEKLGRLKLNGQLLGYSPLSRVVELEALALGVRGKLALWRSLERLAPAQPSLAGIDIVDLTTRAENQLAGLESHRLRAVADAFS